MGDAAYEGDGEGHVIEGGRQKVGPTIRGARRDARDVRPSWRKVRQRRASSEKRVVRRRVRRKGVGGASEETCNFL